MFCFPGLLLIMVMSSPRDFVWGRGDTATKVLMCRAAPGSLTNLELLACALFTSIAVLLNLHPWGMWVVADITLQ